MPTPGFLELVRMRIRASVSRPCSKKLAKAAIRRTGYRGVNRQPSAWTKNAGMRRETHAVSTDGTNRRQPTIRLSVRVKTISILAHQNEMCH
jgi:hypothetical protein